MVFRQFTKYLDDYQVYKNVCKKLPAFYTGMLGKMAGGKVAGAIFVYQNFANMHLAIQCNLWYNSPNAHQKTRQNAQQQVLLTPCKVCKRKPPMKESLSSINEFLKESPLHKKVFPPHKKSLSQKMLLLSVVISVFAATKSMAFFPFQAYDDNPTSRREFANTNYMIRHKSIEWCFIPIAKVRVKSSDNPAALIWALVIFGYTKGDEAAFEEINQNDTKIHDLLCRYFSAKTIKELKPHNENKLKSELRDIINNDILTTSKIKDIMFVRLDVYKHEDISSTWIPSTWFDSPDEPVFDVIGKGNNHKVKHEPLDWCTSIKKVRVKTSGSPAGLVEVKVVPGYKKGDEATLEEINQQDAKIHDFLYRYFSAKTMKELETSDEYNIKAEIRDAINTKILTAPKILDIAFTDFYIQEPKDIQEQDGNFNPSGMEFDALDLLDGFVYDIVEDNGETKCVSLDWYTSIDEVRVKTSDNPAGTVIAKVVPGYKKGDDAAFKEIYQQKTKIHDFLSRYFSERTILELKPSNEGNIEQEICDAINTKILTTSKIIDVVFTRLEVLEPQN